MHWSLFAKLLLKANYERIQRLLIRSHWTIGSPRLKVLHRLPAGRPAQIELPCKKPGVGNNGTPALSYTANCEFTHWTICVGLTASVVSGGAPEMTKPGVPSPSASKLTPSGAPKGLKVAVWLKVRCCY